MFFTNNKYTLSKVVLMAGFLSLSLLGERAMSYEEPPYKVLNTAGDFEYRQYDPYRVSETIIEGARDGDAAASLRASGACADCVSPGNVLPSYRSIQLEKTGQYGQLLCVSWSCPLFRESWA